MKAKSKQSHFLGTIITIMRTIKAAENPDDSFEFTIDKGRPVLSRNGKNVEISQASSANCETRYRKINNKYYSEDEIENNVSLPKEMFEQFFEVIDALNTTKALAEQDERLLADLREAVEIKVNNKRGGFVRLNELRKKWG